MRSARRWRAATLGAWLAACALAAAHAQALDLNTASLAQLEALGGIGTGLAARMIDERTRRPFNDWQDAQRRVKGLGSKVAAQLSEQGLTVNGVPFTPTPR